jgi:hypothetical protein
MSDTEAQARRVYLIVCRDCDRLDDPLPIPFETAAARGKWAAAHTLGTGHDHWLVFDVPEPRRGD